MGNRRLINTAASVDVDSVDDLGCRFAVFIYMVLILVLSRWRQKQTPVRGERQSTKERSQSLIMVESGILHPRPKG